MLNCINTWSLFTFLFLFYELPSTLYYGLGFPSFMLYQSFVEDDFLHGTIASYGNILEQAIL